MDDIARIGILGGSGWYRMAGLEDVAEHQPDTPWGRPSDAILTGRLDGVPVAFLARHGRGHRLLPTEIPYRANIFALKQLGVRYLLSFSAVGSLQESIHPLDLVLPDQFLDFTRHRANTFFGEGIVGHVSMAHPTCDALRSVLATAAEETGVTRRVELHRGGTYVCIEGPQFSTQAESFWYRSLGASVIGMTNMPEARLAREAQMAYATLAMVTDYDCWHPREAHVTAQTAMANLARNAEHAEIIARAAIRHLAETPPASAAHGALDTALATPLDALDETQRARLDVLRL